MKTKLQPNKYSSIEEWVRDNTYNDKPAFVNHLRTLDLTNEQVLEVLNLVSQFCMICYDGLKPCFCNWDE